MPGAPTPRQRQTVPYAESQVYTACLHDKVRMSSTPGITSSIRGDAFALDRFFGSLITSPKHKLAQRAYIK